MTYVSTHVSDTISVDVYSLSEQIAYDSEAVSECFRRVAEEIGPATLLAAAKDIFEHDDGEAVKEFLVTLHGAIEDEENRQEE